MSADPGTEWSGPWANDAQRLFRMLQQPAGSSGSEGGPGGDTSGGGHSPQSHASPAECTYCPLCQAMAMIRRSGPELLDRVAEFATGLAATLRATGPAPDSTDRTDGPESPDGHGSTNGTRAAGAQDDASAGPGWAASVDDVGGDAGQNAAGPGRDARSAGGPAGPADPADRPDRPLVPPMVRIDITD